MAENPEQDIAFFDTDTGTQLGQGSMISQRVDHDKFTMQLRDETYYHVKIAENAHRLLRCLTDYAVWNIVYMPGDALMEKMQGSYDSVRAAFRSLRDVGYIRNYGKDTYLIKPSLNWRFRSFIRMGITSKEAVYNVSVKKTAVRYWLQEEAKRQGGDILPDIDTTIESYILHEGRDIIQIETVNQKTRKKRLINRVTRTHLLELYKEKRKMMMERYAKEEKKKKESEAKKEVISHLEGEAYAP